jgi:hypothetical protein
VDFADYLSTAHSWYKHLPRPPGCVFYVFFDPSAMMTPLPTRPHGGRTGSAGYSEIVGSGHFHYSTRATADYRAAFSICSWLQPEDGESIPHAIHDVDGTALLLPPRVSGGTDSLVYLSTMCFQPHPGARGLDAAALRDEAAALRERLRRDPESAALGRALARTLELAHSVAGVEEVLAQHNGALLGGERKRHELLQAIYEKQHRDERAAIVDALVQQAEAIWGQPLRTS